MRIAIYPGSFDPVTKGHLDIIERISKIFDKVVVCVMVNAMKNPMFTLEERVDMIERVTRHLPNVEVDSANELLATYAGGMGSHVVIKGLRAVSDFEKEFQMALINKKINPELETMFLSSSERYTYLSSSAVKEMAMFGADLKDFVPEEIIGEIRARTSEIYDGR